MYIEQPRFKPHAHVHTQRREAREGYRSDIGLYVRSSWEANFARYLNHLKAEQTLYRWEYESDLFIFEGVKPGGTRAYCPDFKVWDEPDDTPYFFEVKGFMDAKSKLKMRRMKEQYPHVSVTIVDAPVYRSIEKWAIKLIPNWEV